MRNGSLVKNSTNQVHQYGDEKDDGEYTAGADASGFMRLHASTCMLRPHFEEICTFVGICANKGRGCLSVQGISVAQEGDC
jgi:hypothetical protein